MNRLFYNTAPKEWKEGLPIGNGRLAGMVWGEEEDIITLNHEWLWTGRNKDRKPPQTAEGLELARNVIRSGDKFMATALTNSLYSGQGFLSRTPGHVDDYQPAGELRLKLLGNAAFSERALDINQGVASVVRKSTDQKVSGEFFADCVGQCISARWTGTKPFSAELLLKREEEEGTSLELAVTEHQLRLCGKIEGGICFAIQIEASTDGNPAAEGEKLLIENATYIQCMINMATSHEDLEKELSSYKFLCNSYEDVKEGHTKRFRELMERVSFGLEEEGTLAELTTDERIRRLKEGKQDNGMAALYFNYGRYLLISSSICGELPANLQGKWNDSLTPPWNCDYHFDINLQMNYWMAEPAGMPECANALIRYVRSFLESGREAAQSMYGCRGIVLPIQTDAWGVSTPESFGWAAWIGAAAWIARHLWEHYRYSGDRDYLKNQAYEFFKETAEFYEDYLQKDEKGVYQILPSQSPENTVKETGLFPVLIDQSSAMDVQLCYDVLGYAIQTAEILGVDEEKITLWKEIRSHLPGFPIGTDGRLMEWQKEYEEKEPGHRHLSHLYGIYPSDLFTPDTRKEQYEAGIRSLYYRLSHGGGHTGWSRAWVSCMMARIGNKEGFYEHFMALLKDFATVSLLDICPPDYFQIDGNLGATAAVIEAVVSYYDQTAHLLCGIPKEWERGYLNNVLIPGGHKLKIAWENGRLKSLEVEIGFEGKVCLEWEGNLYTAEGVKGQQIQVL